MGRIWVCVPPSGPERVPVSRRMGAFTRWHEPRSMQSSTSPTHPARYARLVTNHRPTSASDASTRSVPALPKGFNTMKIRSIVSACSATALLAFSLAACAVDAGGEEETAASSDAIQAAAPLPAKIAPLNPCARMLCPAGTACDAKAAKCVPFFDCSMVRCAAGTRNVPTLGCCLPTCGGMTGRRCIGGGACVDDPTSGCDWSKGMDCGGVCVGGRGGVGPVTATPAASEL